MITKTITYKDYNGNERTEDFLFNLTEAELTEMEMSVAGGLAEKINKIAKTQKAPELIKIFKDLINKSYGEKSDDGRRFVKVNDSGVPLYVGFSQTEAYSKLFMELAFDAEKAAEFVNGIVPANVANSIAKMGEPKAIELNK